MCGNIYGGIRGHGEKEWKVKGDANDLLPKKFIRHGQISGEFIGELSTEHSSTGW